MGALPRRRKSPPWPAEGRAFIWSSLKELRALLDRARVARVRVLKALRVLLELGRRGVRAAGATGARRAGAARAGRARAAGARRAGAARARAAEAAQPAAEAAQ